MTDLQKCLCALGGLFVVLPLVAAEPADSSQSWSWRIELSNRYDSNVTELSDTDRDRVEDPDCRSTPSCASRFVIKSPDDFVVTPYARIDWSHGAPGSVETTARVEARVNRYAENSVKDYERYSVRLSRDLTPARNFDTTLILRASDTPHFYLRELTVPEASRVQGTTVRDSARYASMRYGVALNQLLVPGRLDIEASRDRDDRDYDVPFDERDGDLSGLGVELTLRVTHDRGFTLRGGYQSESYDAAGDQARTIAIEPDISSDRKTASLGTDFRWGRQEARRGVLSIDLKQEQRDFLSDEPTDVYHFGRRDTRFGARIEVRQPVGEHFYLELGVEHEDNESDLGPAANSSSSDEATDYTRSLGWASLGWVF